MEFILNNKKYSILNQELYINYIMVDSYFKDYSKYEYNISFDFLNHLYELDKIEFKDILEGSEILEEMIEKNELNFIPYGLKIEEHLNGNFKISYQDMEFLNIKVGEAIPLLIALYSLLNAEPIVSMFQIKEELDYFIELFRNYPTND